MEKEVELKALGNKIKLAREELGISQTQLAYMVGKDQPSINRLERGRINPSYIYLLEICVGLDIPLYELLKNIN